MKITNWKEYNASLKKRGEITLWLDEASIDSWTNKSSTHTSPGRPIKYTDAAITCALTVRAVFSLPLRQTQGFLKSVMKLLSQDLPIPDFSTLSRRLGALDLPISFEASGKQVHMVLDSTGLKVFGEGEWKTRQHGATKRRTWRKLHLGVDASSPEIIACAVTTANVHDGEMLKELAHGQDDLSHLSADGAYDSHDIHDYLEGQKIVANIPPRVGSILSQHGNSKLPAKRRDELIRMIRKRGRKAWKASCGYHRRSLAETAMYRMKKIFGASLSSRCFDRQATECFLRANALNRMSALGLPRYTIERY